MSCLTFKTMEDRMHFEWIMNSLEEDWLWWDEQDQIYGDEFYSKMKQNIMGRMIEKHRQLHPNLRNYYSSINKWIHC